MLRPRISPVLLLSGTGLVKTKKFERYKYLGDAINVLKIFNELYVDEIMIYDISKGCSEIQFDLIKKIAREANMSLTYGGKINTVNSAVKLISQGCEKISVCSELFNESLINDIASVVGSQSIAVTLDYKEGMFGSAFFVSNGSSKIKQPLPEIVKYISRLPIGEIIIQNISRDGTRGGYSTQFIDEFSALNLPLKLVGGCKDQNSILDVHQRYPHISYGVGSHFVLTGKLDAVLVSYDVPEL